MPDQKIFIIGKQEYVLLFGLLGIEGKILKNPKEFQKEFNILKNQASIAMIIVALDLQDEDIDFLIDFKLKERKPFVYVLPDIFDKNIKNEDLFSRRITKLIGKIII